MTGIGGVGPLAATTTPDGGRAASTGATRRGRPQRHLLALVLCALWFLPINFAVFEGPVRAAYMVLLAIAIGCALIQLARGDGIVAVVLATLSMYLAIQLLSGVSVQFSSLLLAQLLAGIALQRRMPGPIAVPMFLAATTSSSLVVDQVSKIMRSYARYHQR